MKKIKKIFFAFFISLLFLSCGKPFITEQDNVIKINSFREVPGITNEEKAAIEALQKEITYFVYGMPQSTEAFMDTNGEIRGFSALFCEWMSDIFGIKFRPQLFDWLSLLAGLDSCDISFTGELTANEERMNTYHMTTDIASRELKYFCLKNSRPAEEIINERLLKCGFIRGTTTINTITAELAEGTYEIVFLSDVNLVYEALLSGQIDVFYYSGAIEANFIEHGEIVAHDFYPLIYRPVSLTTKDDDLKPIIDVMEKILENGGLRYLTELYNRGAQEYLIYKLQKQLTDREREFILRNPDIKIAVDPNNYPNNFFDKRENKWKGIFIDILDEMTKLTGLNFVRINNENSNISELYNMVISGEAALAPAFIQLSNHEEYFIWPDITQITDNFALISNTDFPDIKTNEVLYVKVGLIKNTAYTSIFEKWFYNHINTNVYENIEEAFDALQRGEIDMLMATQKRLLYLTHYLELPNFKSNIVFNFTANYKFAFNAEQEILCSIFNKALSSIDMRSISEKWIRQTYDYRIKLIEARRPLFVGLSVLFLCVLALVAALFLKSHHSGRRLEKLVEVRTRDLELKTSMIMTIMDASPDFIFCKDLDSRYTQCSKSTINMFNVNSKDIIGKTDAEVFGFSQERANNYINEEQRIIKNKFPLITEETIALPNDNERNILLETIKTPLIQNGAVIGIMGISRNITNRKTIERDLEIQTTTLNALFDSIPDLIFTLDRNLRFTQCNKKFLNHFGLSKEEIIGRDEDALHITQEFTDEHNKWNRKVIDECKTYIFEEYVPGADGTTPFFETIKSPLLFNDANIGLLGIARDITKRKEMEEKALAASYTKSAFLANMSHEIRTPMNSIVGFSELAMDSEDIPKIKDYLGKIKTNSEWLLQIINNILDISKIESGKMELEKIPFDMHDLFTSCRALVLPKALEKGLVLHFYAEPSLGKIPLGDPTRLRQVFINFLSNSIKFTNSGIVKLFSKISNSTSNTLTMNFEIKDSGIGMTPEQIDRIFDPFIQAESGITRKYGGTGLGLSIAKNIIEMMGGKIKIESTPKVGTIISFDLTFDTIDKNADNVRDKIMKHVEIEKPSFHGEVLLCEDNTMNQEVISEHLSRVGLKTIIAENGKIGVEMVQNRQKNNEKQFDLIFMDIHMPVMDGIEASLNILKLNTGVPIIAMTANIMSTDREIYFENGMSSCIGKPFTSQELWHCLIKYLTPLDKQDMNARSESNNDFNKRIQLLFVKDNRSKFSELTKALEDNDIKLAHRLAHTLKSNAGQIGKTLLQQAAADIENRLTGGKNNVTHEQLKIIEEELTAVINEYLPLLEEQENKFEKPDIKPLDLENIKEIFTKLEPLLKTGNSECMNFMEALNLIPGCDNLIQHMDNYEFSKALSEFEILKHAYLNKQHN